LAKARCLNDRVDKLTRGDFGCWTGVHVSGLWGTTTEDQLAERLIWMLRSNLSGILCPNYYDEKVRPRNGTELPQVWHKDRASLLKVLEHVVKRIRTPHRDWWGV
jgi:hypothetical protein